jgi:hypothetical protein
MVDVDGIIGMSLKIVHYLYRRNSASKAVFFSGHGIHYISLTQTCSFSGEKIGFSRNDFNKR